MKPKKQLHSQLVKDIRDLLSWNGIYNFPVVQSMFSSVKGISDIIAIRDGILIAIEVKVGKDKLSDHQEIFLSHIFVAGGIAFVARSLDDVVKELNLKCILGGKAK